MTSHKIYHKIIDRRKIEREKEREKRKYRNCRDKFLKKGLLLPSNNDDDRVYVFCFFLWYTAFPLNRYFY